MNENVLRTKYLQPKQILILYENIFIADEEIFNDNYLHIDFVLKYAIKSKVVKYIKNIPLPENFKTPKPDNQMKSCRIDDIDMKCQSITRTVVIHNSLRIDPPHKPFNW